MNSAKLDVLTPRQCAAMLHVSTGTLANWRTKGVGPPCTWIAPRTPRYLKVKVESWLMERTFNSTTSRDHCDAASRPPTSVSPCLQNAPPTRAATVADRRLPVRR